MAAPTTPTNLETIFDCLEHLFNTITHANGYRTDGVLVDRNKDPRLARQSKPDEYEAKQCALTLTRARRKLDRERSIGRHVWDCWVNVMGIRTMTVTEDAGGRTLDELAADLQDDVRCALKRDFGLAASAEALGVDRPMIVALSVDEVLDDEGANFPDAHFVCVVYFRMEEPFPSGTPGFP